MSMAVVPFSMACRSLTRQYMTRRRGSLAFAQEMYTLFTRGSYGMDDVGQDNGPKGPTPSHIPAHGPYLMSSTTFS